MATLATITEDGRPHLVPVVFAVEGDKLWTAVDDKPKTSRILRRIANIRANPAVSLLVDHYDDDWTALWWVRVDGAARELGRASGEEAHGIRQLVTKYPQYQANPPAGPVVAVEIQRWSSWSAREAGDRVEERADER